MVRITTRTIGALFMIISLVGGAGVAAAAGGALFVTVEDSTGDVPTDGSIVIEDADGNVVKDVGIDDGTHTFENLEDGEYNLTVRSYGYVTPEHALSVDNGDVTVDGAASPQSSLDVTLADATEVTGNFTANALDDGEAVEDAEFALINDGEVVESASTDASGVASLTDYEGTYDKLRVSADGYKTVTISDYAFDGSAKTIQLQEGSDGLFGGSGSSSGSSSNDGLFVGIGVLILLIGGGWLAARAEE